MTTSGMRVETDGMGEVSVPEAAYYGAQTRRAELNFRISPLRMPRAIIRAFGLIKKAAAEIHAELGPLLVGEEHVRLLGAATQRDDRRVLEQEQRVADAAVDPRGHEALLEGVRLGVAHRPQPASVDGAAGHVSPPGGSSAPPR